MSGFWTGARDRDPHCFELEKKGIVNFPTSGTELGVVCGSPYLPSDRDIDVFVAMPQGQLFKELVGVLTPLPKQSGDFKRCSFRSALEGAKVSDCPYDISQPDGRQDDRSVRSSDTRVDMQVCHKLGENYSASE